MLQAKPMPAVEPLVREIETVALEGGATAVKQITPHDVIVAQWVRTDYRIVISFRAAWAAFHTRAHISAMQP